LGLGFQFIKGALFSLLLQQALLGFLLDLQVLFCCQGLG